MAICSADCFFRILTPKVALAIMLLGTDLLNDANHLVANGYAWNGTGHTAVFDMQIAGADTTERNAHNSIARAL